MNDDTVKSEQTYSSAFEINIGHLEKISANLASLMRKRHESGIPLVTNPEWKVETLLSKTGLPVAELVAENGRRIALSSRYNPVREAEQYVEKHIDNAGKRNFVVALGMGMAYHIEEYLKEADKQTAFMIIEADAEIFYQAIVSRDLSSILTRQRTALYIGTNPEESMEIFRSLFKIVTFKGLYILEWDYYANTPFAEIYNEFRPKIRANMLQIAGNLQTMMVMGESYTVNSLFNFKHLIKDPGIKNLFGKFDGIPGVVVSAGPSLNKNAHLLKELENRALICAVDTAVKPLMKMGITPHIVTTGDPQEANYRHLRGVVLPDSYLVCDPQAPVKTVDEWAGGRFFCSFRTRFFQWFESRIDVGPVDVWGSVATIAYDVVLRLGCNPVIFIGQDLAFSWGRTYVEGTYFEDEDKSEMSVDAFKKKEKNIITCKDIYGNEVPTNRQMFAYCDFFLKRFMEQHGRRIVNATEGGILHGENVLIKTFRDAIDEFCGSEFDIFGILGEAHVIGNGYKLPYLASEMDRLIYELREMMNHAKKGYEYSNTLTELLNMEKQDLPRIKETYNKMVGIRKKMDGLNEATPFIEMVNQAGLYLYYSRMCNIEFKDGLVDNDAMTRMNEAMSTLFSTSLATSAQLLPLFENARDDLRAIMKGDKKEEIVLTL